MQNNNANSNLIILQSHGQIDKDFNFLKDYFKNILTISLHSNENVSKPVFEGSIYLLAYEDGCSLAAQFEKNYKLKIKAMFLITPFLGKKKKHLWIYSMAEKSICKIKAPVVIFNSNKESIMYQNCVANLINKCRMMYNIIVKSKTLDVLDEDSLVREQLVQAIRAYINN